MPGDYIGSRFPAGEEVLKQDASDPLECYEPFEHARGRVTKIQFSIPQASYDALPELVRALFPENSFSVSSLVTSNITKFRRGHEAGWLAAGIYMAPSDTLGIFNVCGSESTFCRATCLGKGKRLGLARGHKALIARSLFWHFHKLEFQDQVLRELAINKRAAERGGFRFCIRMNGTSDIAHESFAEGHFLQEVMAEFAETPVYDYTKHFGRVGPGYRRANGVERYHLTFSHSGTNWELCERALDLGVNVAVVFAPKVPAEYRGRPVIDGDANDLRFLDPPGVIVGLKQKKSYRHPTQNGWVTPEEAGPFVVRP